MADNIGWASYATFSSPVLFHNQQSNRAMADADDHDFLELAEAYARQLGSGPWHRGMVYRLIELAGQKTREGQELQEWLVLPDTAVLAAIEQARARLPVPERKLSEGWQDHPMAD